MGGHMGYKQMNGNKDKGRGGEIARKNEREHN